MYKLYFTERNYRISECEHGARTANNANIARRSGDHITIMLKRL
jgi:hypothetical protein